MSTRNFGILATCSHWQWKENSFHCLRLYYKLMYLFFNFRVLFKMFLLMIKCVMPVVLVFLFRYWFMMKIGGFTWYAGVHIRRVPVRMNTGNWIPHPKFKSVASISAQRISGHPQVSRHDWFRGPTLKSKRGNTRALVFWSRPLRHVA